MKHGVFEEVANETVLETIEKEPNDEDNARIMRNYKNHVMSYVLGCLNVKAVVKCLLQKDMQSYTKLRTWMEISILINCVKKISQVILN